MLNCRRSATSIRARYGQWAGVKCVPRSTSTPAVNDALLSDACSLSRTRKGKLVYEATVEWNRIPIGVKVLS